MQLSIKSLKKVTKILEALDNQESQVLISLDSFQAQKPKKEKHYSVDIVYPQYGEIFRKEDK